MKECEACGDMHPANLLACSGACMRIVRFARISQGLPDPMK